MRVATTIERVPRLRRRRLTQDEIDRYLTTIATQLPLLAEERDELLARLRRWAETDDGKPVYMLNLMRYYDPPRPYPGAPTDFSGTSEQANAHYKRGVTPLALRRRSYPLLGGQPQGATLTPSAPALDDSSRVLVMRYPSRRAFLDLLADPAYAPLWPYKAMAVQLMLLPVSGDLVVPDLRVRRGGPDRGGIGEHHESRGWTTANGVITLLLGLLILFGWPGRPCGCWARSRRRPDRGAVTFIALGFALRRAPRPGTRLTRAPDSTSRKSFLGQRPRGSHARRPGAERW